MKTRSVKAKKKSTGDGGRGCSSTSTGVDESIMKTRSSKAKKNVQCDGGRSSTSTGVDESIVKTRSGKTKKNSQLGGGRSSTSTGVEETIVKTRSAKAKKNIQSDPGCSCTSTVLDENLWGTLQHHINLAESVYSKLPFEEFFQLRTVCKDWYVIACKRLGLKEPIHKPFFTLFTKGEDGRLDGLLIYNALSQSWVWRPCWTHNHTFESVASKGVVYSAHDMSWANYASVFHWQSKTYQRLVPPPTPPSIYEKMILGMIVAEDLSSFKVVRGNQDFDTQVYESGVWQSKPCRAPKSETDGPLRSSTGCVDCNGRVYITTEHTRDISVYDFEKARWSSLFSPGDWASRLRQHYCLDTLGAWNSRVFNVTCDFEYGHRKKIWSLKIWELVDEELHKWNVYDCMPKGLCSWLRSTTGFREGLYTKDRDISTQASFCGDFMLVYSWDFVNGSAGRFCLFNMATKNWQKLNVAAGTVAISEGYASDPYSDDSLDSLDLYANANESSLDEYMMVTDDDDTDSFSGWDFYHV